MKTLLIGLFLALSLVAHANAQGYYGARSSLADLAQNAVESLVTVSVVREGKAAPVAAGLVVRSDGLVAVAGHLVKDAGEIQVKLRNGETYDKVQVIFTDERRNVSFLRLPVVGLRTLATAYSEEGAVGSRVVALYGGAGPTIEAVERLLGGVVLADEIPGAGEGYRALKLSKPLPEGANGILVNENGYVLGLLVAKPKAYQSYAVPMSSLMGHVAQLTWQQPSTVSVPSSGGYYSSYPRPAASPTPVPITQSSVSVPERGVLPLDPKGPGSVVVKPVTPADILAQSKTVYVTSRSATFKPEQLVNELLKRNEWPAFGLSFVDDYKVADLVLTIDHVLFTWKYTFDLAHQRTGVVVATGDVIVWDGNLGSPKMAKRVVEKLSKLRPPAEKKETKDEKPASKPDGKGDAGKKKGDN
jgi:S1-C subfamily serine protease